MTNTEVNKRPDCEQILSERIDMILDFNEIEKEINVNTNETNEESFRDLFLRRKVKELNKAECDLIKPECDSIEPECDLIEPECDSTEPECDLLEPECDLIEHECDSIEHECDLIESECDLIEPESGISSAQS